MWWYPGWRKYLELDAEGKSFSGLRAPTNKSGGEICGVVWRACVVSGNCRLEVGCDIVGFVSDHLGGDIVGKLFYLFADVPQKCVA